ncbi:MAG: extracellular solute-binding protein [Acidobacteria bacterium]|nr:extracellular solute-binding protein [Acidobacteriota bacterium]MBI3658181.1 extracellular solute-binding protein [Acidobacteriota bacterium]
MSRKLIFVICILLVSCARREQQVVIYTSLDQMLSEPVLREFEQKSGIKVKAVYDTEASKTTGLVNRLIAEKDYPKADVFWNSEICRTILLKEKGLLARYRSAAAEDIPEEFKDAEGYWTGFAARLRVLVYNTNLVARDEVPQSIFELTQPKWKGHVALANPLFGTTATHMAALFVHLGPPKAKEYLRALKANGVIIVEGNSTVRDRVADGEVKIGFTDTDDVTVAIRSGKPVKMIFPDQDAVGTLLIPNTIALIKGAPRPDNGKKLIDYLLSREVEESLAQLDSAQIPVRDGLKAPTALPSLRSIRVQKLDYSAMVKQLNATTDFCRELFLR